MCIATLSDDSDIFSMFMFGLIRNQLAELDGSDRVDTCRNPMHAVGQRCRGDPKTRTEPWGLQQTSRSRPASCGFSHTRRQRWEEDRLFFLSFFFFRFSELPQPDGNRFPMSDAGDPATRRSQIPPASQKSRKRRLHRSSSGRCGGEREEERGRRAVFPASAAGPREGSQGFSREGGQGRAASSPGRPHLLSASNAALLPL